jgi:hypothetical protein
MPELSEYESTWANEGTSYTRLHLETRILSIVLLPTSSLLIVYLFKYSDSIFDVKYLLFSLLSLSSWHISFVFNLVKGRVAAVTRQSIFDGRSVLGQFRMAVSRVKNPSVAGELWNYSQRNLLFLFYPSRRRGR